VRRSLGGEKNKKQTREDTAKWDPVKAPKADMGNPIELIRNKKGKVFGFKRAVLANGAKQSVRN